MAGDDLQNLLKSGIQAARSGNKEVARDIFQQVIRLDSRNELAWMWLASVLDSTQERKRALQKVLQINPDNQRAQQALQKLGGTGSLRTPVSTGELVPPANLPPAPGAPASPPAPPLQMRAAPPRRRSRGFSSLTYYISIILALIVIGAGVVLVVQQVNEENQPATATPVEAPPVVLATRLPPTPVPQVFRTVVPGSIVSSVDLPPTWTPAPTNTPAPTATTVEIATNFSELTLVFSGADTPVDLRRLMLVQASGADMHPLNVPITAAQITYPARVTPVPPPQEVSPDEAASLPTEQPVGEASEPTAEAAPAQEPGLYDQMEFLDPAFSPDGTQVAFTIQIAADLQEIFVLNQTTGVVRQLTTLGGNTTDGSAWSPDGTLLAFSSNAPTPNGNEGYDVYMVDVNTGEVTNLTNGNGQNREPAWSPDGAKVAFSSDRTTPGELEVFSMQISSGEANQLTDAVNSSFSPAYSHDGKYIAFISNRGGDNDLYIMNADGTNEQLITLNDANWDDRDPAWSPDDAWIAISSNRENERVLQLWLVSTDGREWRRVTEAGGTSRFADWRP